MTRNAIEATIPVNQPCKVCSALTWRKELGASDRWWHNGYVCADCHKEILSKVPAEVWVSADNKEIIAQGFEWMKNPKKKYRLEDFNKANDRMSDMNLKFNAAALGCTVEEYKRRGLK